MLGAIRQRRQRTDSMLHDPVFVVNLVLYAGAVVAIIYLAL